MSDMTDDALVAKSAPDPNENASYVDWPAIFAGAVTASGIAVVFAGFGAALGLSAVSFEAGQGSAVFGAILFGIWMLVTLLSSYFAGGYIAGRVRGRADISSADEVRTRDGIHGLVVWALGAIIGALILGSAATSTARLAGDAVSTTAEATSTVAASVAQGAGDLAQGAASLAQTAPSLAEMLPQGLQSDPMEYINSTLLRGSEMELPEGTAQADDPLSSETRAILLEVLRTGEISQEDRSYLEAEIADRTTLSETDVDARIDQAISRVQEFRAEAEARLDEVQTRLQQAEETAREAADAARASAVITGFALAAAMFVAAVAAFFGGRIGGRHRDEGKIYPFLSHPA